MARAGVVSLLLVALAAAVGVVIEHYLNVPNILLVFLPPVLLVAVRYGFVAAAFTSLLCVAAASYFTEPVYSFAVAEAGNLWALLMFVAVAAYTSNLAAKIEQRAEAERRHNRVIGELHAFSSRLAALSSIDEIAAEAVEQIGRILEADLVLLVAKDGALRVLPPRSDAELGPTDRIAANACWERRQPVGAGTDILPAAARYYRPLETGRGLVGVLGLRPSGDADSEGELDADDSRLLDALCDQLAVSLDRAMLADEMHATAMLAETEKLRSALLTSVSHDLKTPLASILGNVSSLRQFWSLYDEPTRDEMLAFAEDETLRLGQFVENFLQMTRIDAGAVRPNLEEVDLSDLIGTALQRTEKQTAAHVVRTELPQELPMVSLDFVLAEHVLVNLIDNAAKYSPPGSTITITAAAEPECLRIDVLDEGPGIRDEDVKRVFERFFRAGAADHRRAGAGLGLAIAKGFVEAMGGRIEAGNRRDRTGAVFTVRLPSGAGTGGRIEQEEEIE